MGQKASAAALLTALTSPEDNWYRDARKMVDRFSLFAIILADPVKDPDFYNLVQSDFSYFDRMTGRNFLFFSLVKESDLPANGGGDFRLFTDISAYRQNEVSEKVYRSELAIHAICNVLGLEYNDSPFLIVSNNIGFGSYCKISTNTHLLERQLRALSTVSDLLPGGSRNKSLFEMLSVLDLSGDVLSNLEEIDRGPGRIKLASEILKMVTVRNRDAAGIQRTINSLNRKLNLQIGRDNLLEIGNLVQCVVSEPMRRLGRYNFHLSFDPAMVNESQSIYRRVTQQLKSEWSNLEHSTRNFLDVADFLDEHLGHRQELNDFSPYTLELSKCFETEINYSLVQFMRYKLGISMPSYFVRYCPVRDNMPVLPDLGLTSGAPRDIYLNRHRRGRWIPPGLGESRIVYLTLRNRNLPGWYVFEQDLDDVLTSSWSKIQKIRNDSAHTEVIPREVKNELDKTFSELHKCDVLNKITALKTRLKGMPIQT